MLPGTGTPADFDPILPSGLDTVESTQQPDPISLLFDPPTDPDVPIPTFRHRSWEKRRIKIATALAVANVGRHRHRSFVSCGCQAWVLRSIDSPHDFKVVPDFCHDRWCVPCGSGRAARIAANLLEKLGDRQTRFITLTLNASDHGLRERIDRLLVAFGKLRRRVFWKDRVPGGAAFLHITRGRQGLHWHPHLHIVVEGTYIPKEQLVQTWLELTGDSFVVDIQLVRQQHIVGRYVTQYCSKTLDSKLIKDPVALVEAINALRGRKLLYAFGSWSRWQLLTHPSDEAWTIYGHVNELMHRAANGDELAELVLLVLQHSPDVFAGEIFCVDLQPEPPPCATAPNKPTSVPSQLSLPSVLASTP